MPWHEVAAVGEIPPGGRKLVSVDGREIALFNANGEFFAILNRCPHQGGSLYAGRLTGLVRSGEPGCYTYTRDGEIIRCPWHGWEFDLRTGKSWAEPSRIRTKVYDVAVAAEGGQDRGAVCCGDVSGGGGGGTGIGGSVT